MKNNMKKIILSLIIVLSFFVVGKDALAAGNKTPMGCTIVSFTANPYTVTLGQSSVLSWVLTDCNQVTISNLNYIAPSSGSQTVSPTTTTTYVLTAYDLYGSSVTQSVTISVIQASQNCIITSFSASPISINSGGSSNLSWSTSNCNSASISPNVGNVVTSGSQTIFPTITTTYTLTALGTNGVPVTQTTMVTVNQLQNCSIYSFNANPNSIDSGDSVTLNWSTNNCTSVNISPNVGNVAASGSQTIYPTNTTTYILTAYGTNGAQQTQSTVVSVNQDQYCYIEDFTVDGSSSTTVSNGDAVNIEWDTSGNNCSVHVSGPNLNSSSRDGNRTIYPTYSGTYTLTVHGSNSGTQSRTVYVNVDDNYYYDNCTISYFNASPTSISSGGSTTLSWSTNNCRSVNISNLGSVNNYGSQTVYPTYTTNYILNAYNQNNGRAVTRTIQVYVNNYTPNPTPIYNTCAVTGVTTNVTENSVTLNGLVTNPSSYNASTYFEYGTTVNLGSQTNSRMAYANNTFSEVLTGLSTNTIYFYRLVANCNNTISKGAIEVFKTLGKQTNPVTIVRQGTTIIGTESPIMLKIENRFQSIKVADTIDYTVTYKNISKKTLTRPILQVILPKGISFLNSSRGTYDRDTATLTVALEDLIANSEGVIYMEGRVDSLDSGNAQIVTTALLVYTSSNGAQENAMAYVLNNPILSGSSLTGLALFGWFFRIGILGWLLIFIIILLLILLSRRYYHRETIQG